MTDTNISETQDNGSGSSVEVQRLVSGLEVRVKKLRAEYALTRCRQTQSIISGQLIELAGVIYLLRPTVLFR